MPEYKELPPKGGSGFHYTVIVGQKAYVGSTRPRKQDAKQSAANTAIQILGLCKSAYM